MMSVLRSQIAHVVCIVKDGRTFDEVLGDLTNGANADPGLAQFGRHVTPNAHRIAANFVTFDNVFAGSDGWVVAVLERASRISGLGVRTYGVAVETIGAIGTQAEPNRTPFANGTALAKPATETLAGITDPYFRGPDPAYPDTWRVDEWQREFAQQVASNAMPALTLMRLAGDRIGALGPDALAHNGTPETQVADNDFAFGRVVDAVAHSRYAGSTLIVVVEVNSQNGPDHIDGQRSLAYLVGPFVAQTRLIGTRATAESFVRLIEDVLGFPRGGDGPQPVMEAFDDSRPTWKYSAVASTMLRATTLLATDAHVRFERKSDAMPQHDSAYWGAAVRQATADRFNVILWSGLNGERPYPTTRSGARMGQEYQETP